MELIGIFLLFFVLWLTTTSFARKGWPVSLGILAGILLQIAGRVMALVATLCIAMFGKVPFAISLVLAPLLGSLLPIVVAVLLPVAKKAQFAEAASDHYEVPCPQCGRLNATTSPVCPRCDHRMVPRKVVVTSDAGSSVTGK